MAARKPRNLRRLENSYEQRRQNYRFLHETSLYETAIGLYPVLLGLILTDSLKSMAQDIISRPISGNWTLRFLTCTLLILASVWLHVWIATFRRFIIKASSAERHQFLPGVKFEHVQGYGAAIASFWLGIVQLIIFTCMAYSVNDETKFFAGGIAYSITILLYEASAIGNDNLKNPAAKAEVWKRPRRSIASLWRGRFLPLSQLDRESYLHGASERQQVLNAQANVYDVAIALTVTAVSTFLIVLVHLLGASWWIALIGLVGMIAGTVVDYLMYPHFYTI